MSFLLWSPISFYDYSFWNTLCEVVSVSNNRPPFLSFHSASHGTHWMYPHPLLKWIFIESFLFKKYLFSKDMSLSLHKNNTICFTHTHTHSLKRIVLKIYISIWISKSFLTNHFFFVMLYVTICLEHHSGFDLHAAEHVECVSRSDDLAPKQKKQRL